MPVQIQTSAAKAEIEFVGVELIIGIQLHRTPAADQADFTKGLFFIIFICLLI